MGLYLVFICFHCIVGSDNRLFSWHRAIAVQQGRNPKNEKDPSDGMLKTDSITEDANYLACMTNKTSPPKSKLVYENHYRNFMTWLEKSTFEKVTEDSLLAYFLEKSNTNKPSSLWSFYSMLRKTLRINTNIDIGKFERVPALLRNFGKEYSPDRSRGFTTIQLYRFLEKAPDKKYLMMKIVLMFGVSGQCISSDLLQITIDDVDDKQTVLSVKLFNHKDNTPRIFTVIFGNIDCLGIYRKYCNLRPKNITTRHLLMAYKDGKCSNDVVGVDTIEKIPSKVAKYLKVSNPDSFNGFCFRKTYDLLKHQLGARYTKTEVKEEPQNLLWDERPLVATVVTVKSEVKKEPQDLLLDERPFKATSDTVKTEVKEKPHNLFLDENCTEVINIVSRRGRKIRFKKSVDSTMREESFFTSLNESNLNIILDSSSDTDTDSSNSQSKSNINIKNNNNTIKLDSRSPKVSRTLKGIANKGQKSPPVVLQESSKEPSIIISDTNLHDPFLNEENVKADTELRSPSPSKKEKDSRKKRDMTLNSFEEIKEELKMFIAERNIVEVTQVRKRGRKPHLKKSGDSTLKKEISASPTILDIKSDSNISDSLNTDKNTTFIQKKTGTSHTVTKNDINMKNKNKKSDLVSSSPKTSGSSKAIANKNPDRLQESFSNEPSIIISDTNHAPVLNDKNVIPSYADTELRSPASSKKAKASRKKIKIPDMTLNSFEEIKEEPKISIPERNIAEVITQVSRRGRKPHLKKTGDSTLNKEISTSTTILDIKSDINISESLNTDKTLTLIHKKEEKTHTVFKDDNNMKNKNNNSDSTKLRLSASPKKIEASRKKSQLSLNNFQEITGEGQNIADVITKVSRRGRAIRFKKSVESALKSKSYSLKQILDPSLDMDACNSPDYNATKTIIPKRKRKSPSPTKYDIKIQTKIPKEENLSSDEEDSIPLSLLALPKQEEESESEEFLRPSVRKLANLVNKLRKRVV